MPKDQNLLVVGGTGRNVGKTEFVCRIIEKIAKKHRVYGLKVSTVYPDEGLFHGNHPEGLAESHLFEETRTDTGKDTSRMLQAGATRVFYLREENRNIGVGYNAFRSLIPKNSVVICESNSLADVAEPGLHVVVRSTSGPIKQRALPLLTKADLIVFSDGRSGFRELRQINYTNMKSWHLC